jgi:hypothetical protein
MRHQFPFCTIKPACFSTIFKTSARPHLNYRTTSPHIAPASRRFTFTSKQINTLSQGMVPAIH